MQTRKTFQKSLTLDAVREMKCHPTADQVYAFVSEKYPEISRATIYRNLNQLSEAHEIQRFKNPCGADHFDHQLTPHYHFVCRECGSIINVEMELDAENIKKLCEEKTGCCVSDHILVFEGICGKCRG
ncbi:MAG: transcriptional repressor [Oscillospiraceae bacterium]|nr:transcriptional repressor [Oscillospiraceae bacterium]